ncbi:MAG: hypothetical protein ACE5PM_03115 [Candidatus Hydrothermarchaeales archaeon]
MTNVSGNGKKDSALDGKTPVQEAGIDLDLGGNKWKGPIEKAVEQQQKNGS